MDEITYQADPDTMPESDMRLPLGFIPVKLHIIRQNLSSYECSIFKFVCVGPYFFNVFFLLRQLLVLAVFDRWKQSLIIEVLCEFFFNDFPMWFFRLTSSRAELKLMNIGPAGFHHILWDWFEQSLTFDNIIEMWYHFIPVHWTYF